MAAPKGNQFAVGQGGGRPPHFESVEQLECAIEDYLESCAPQREKLDDGSTITTHGRNPTITGLAYFLGFESRQSFYDYEQNKEFSYTIKRARLMIESNYEQALFEKNAAGPIFALKNFGWKDTQEIKHNIQRNVLSNDPLADDTANDSPAENIKP